MQDTPWGKALGPGILAGGYPDPHLTGENTEAHVTQPVWSKDKMWGCSYSHPHLSPGCLPFLEKDPTNAVPLKIMFHFREDMLLQLLHQDTVSWATQMCNKLLFTAVSSSRSVLRTTILKSIQSLGYYQYPLDGHRYSSHKSHMWQIKFQVSSVMSASFHGLHCVRQCRPSTFPWPPCPVPSIIPVLTHASTSAASQTSKAGPTIVL